MLWSKLGLLTKTKTSFWMGWYLSWPPVMVGIHGMLVSDFGWRFSSVLFEKKTEAGLFGLCYSHRIHGAGIYANMNGVYWWDPCYHI